MTAAGWAWSLLVWSSLGLVFYSYAGYPALVAILARFAPRSPEPGEYTPPVTMVIAAYNEEAVMERKLENTSSLRYPPGRLQVIVAADGSDDGTVEIVSSWSDRGVELCWTPVRAGKMSAINRAMERATGEIVVFSDANNIYDADALLALVRPFADPSVGVASGAKRIVPDGGALAASEGLYWRYESFIKRQESRLGGWGAVAAEIMAVRRDLYRPPPEWVILDDFFIALEMASRGYRVAYVPEARSVERVSASAREERERRARNVAGRYQAMALSGRFLSWRRPLLCWQVVSHKFLRPLVPFAMIGALAGNLLLVAAPVEGVPGSMWASLLRLSPPFGGFLLAVQGIFYLAAALGAVLGRRGPAGRVLYLAAFVVSSNWAALGGFVRWLLGRQSVTWRKAGREAGP